MHYEIVICFSALITAYAAWHQLAAINQTTRDDFILRFENRHNSKKFFKGKTTLEKLSKIYKLQEKSKVHMQGIQFTVDPKLEHSSELNADHTKMAHTADTKPQDKSKKDYNEGMAFAKRIIDNKTKKAYSKEDIDSIESLVDSLSAAQSLNVTPKEMSKIY